MPSDSSFVFWPGTGFSWADRRHELGTVWAGGPSRLWIWTVCTPVFVVCGFGFLVTGDNPGLGVYSLLVLGLFPLVLAVRDLDRRLVRRAEVRAALASPAFAEMAAELGLALHATSSVPPANATPRMLKPLMFAKPAPIAAFECDFDGRTVWIATSVNPKGDDVYVGTVAWTRLPDGPTGSVSWRPPMTASRHTSVPLERRRIQGSVNAIPEPVRRWVVSNTSGLTFESNGTFASCATYEMLTAANIRPMIAGVALFASQIERS